MVNADYFFNVCNEIGLNLASRTEMILKYRCPINYGEILGEALRTNTHVQILGLDVSMLVDPGDDDDGNSSNDATDENNARMLQKLESLLWYLKNGSALRTGFLFSTDDSMETDWADTITSILLKDMAQNSNLQHLIVEQRVELLIPSLIHLLTTASSLLLLSLDLSMIRRDKHI